MAYLLDSFQERRRPGSCAAAGRAFVESGALEDGAHTFRSEVVQAPHQKAPGGLRGTHEAGKVGAQGAGARVEEDAMLAIRAVVTALAASAERRARIVQEDHGMGASAGGWIPGARIASQGVLL